VNEKDLQTSQIVTNSPYIHTVINIQLAKNQKHKNTVSNYKRSKIQAINLESSSLAADELIKRDIEEIRIEKEKQDRLSLKDTRANKSQSVKQSFPNLHP
jgi:hypothetical protein